MLIKQKDSLKPAIQQLEAIVQRTDVLPRVLEQAQVELRTLKAGIRGEKDAAYYIDFDFRPSKNFAVIHDLRFEHAGRVAQIDHLLISRALFFFVLESKSFANSLTITDRGEFHVERNGGIAIPSPIEQNRRHGELLWQLLQDNHIIPTRLGIIPLQPKMFSYVLVSPNSLVKRPSNRTFNTDMVIKADELTRVIESRADNMNAVGTMEALANLVTSETLEQIARKLVALHKPASINYYERFGINPDSPAKAVVSPPNQAQEKPIEQQPVSGYYCFKCKNAISPRVARFCFDNKSRFGGRAYCLDCQKAF